MNRRWLDGRGVNVLEHQGELEIHVGGRTLEGELRWPPGATAAVIFAHGSVSSRWSPRDRALAAALNAAGLGTLLADLLTPQEMAEPELASEAAIDRLADRLLGVTEWLRGRAPDLRLGYCGAGIGAAAALIAAQREPGLIGAIVSRGGRPELAGPAVDWVRAPTLLIVGGEDPELLRLNQWAFRRLRQPRAMGVVPGATRCFEEPGALQDVARLAREWFSRWLVAEPKLAGMDEGESGAPD